MSVQSGNIQIEAMRSSTKLRWFFFFHMPGRTLFQKLRSICRVEASLVHFDHTPATSGDNFQLARDTNSTTQQSATGAPFRDNDRVMAPNAHALHVTWSIAARPEAPTTRRPERDFHFVDMSARDAPCRHHCRPARDPKMP